MFKLLVEMSDRVSQRRQGNNNFYLSVNTAVVGASAYLSTKTATQYPAVVLSIAGFVICMTWAWSIQSYKTLNAAKFAVIHELEKHLPAQPFADEWTHLTGGAKVRHTPFHRVEVVVPWVFAAVHIVQLLSHVPWSDIGSFVCRLRG